MEQDAHTDGDGEDIAGEVGAANALDAHGRMEQKQCGAPRRWAQPLAQAAAPCSPMHWVLRGPVNPSGKLPVTVARDAGQLPIYDNHPYGSAWHQGESIGFKNYVDMTHLPRYPFGFGLSYTTFAYSDLTLSSKELAPTDTLTVSCKVKNKGTVFGTEVVQLYINDLYATMCRPVQELQGFARGSWPPVRKRSSAGTSGSGYALEGGARHTEYPLPPRIFVWRTP